ncbi:cytochrome c biogenesis protein CcdA [Leeia sp. IMCC25680]|uniref:Cytochrome c biogenesis protein CcdA n=2 Tax=Leeia aquatica TaxID=2725557 RepID=A0A847S8W9_9NEIS|nr:cytochrome c biogenesis protein CcdA [Leeia aquatica]
MVWQSMGPWLLAILAGGLSTLSPCVFPLLPLVAGGSLQRHRAGPLMMGLGMVTAFAVLGLLLGTAGPLLGLNDVRLRQFGGGILLLLGAVLLLPGLRDGFSRWISPLANGANRWSARLDTASLAGYFGLGAVLGLVWSPCSGPLLISALTLVATEGHALQGTVTLAAFGLGAAIPLVLAAYASRAAFLRVRERVLKHAYRLQQGFGLLLMLLGVAILLGWDKRVEALLVGLMPDQWVSLTTRF